MQKIVFTISFVIFVSSMFAQNENTKAKENFQRAKYYYEYIKYDSAISLYSSASGIYQKSKKMNEYFDCQIGIGQCLIKKGEYSKALDFFEDLQKNAEKQFGYNEPIVATSFYYQGYANLYLNQMEKAETLIKKSLELRQKYFGENNQDVAQTYNLMAQYYLFQGNYPEAFENFDKSLKIRLSIFGQNNADVANSLSNISSVYYYEGNLDSAISLAKRALQIRQNVLPAEHPDFIISYNSLAIYQNEKMQFKDALDIHLKNLVLCEKYYGHSNSITGTIYNNLGVAYLKLKDYKNALKNLNEAYDIRKSLKIPNYGDIAATKLNIGDVYDETFQFEKSIKIKKQALTLLINSVGEFHPNTAIAYNSIAVTYKKSGNISESVNYLEKALAIFDKIQGEINLNSAMCLVNLGADYASLDQNQLSLKYYYRAKSIYQKINQSSNEMAILCNNIGEVLNALGEYNQAIDYLEESLRIKESLFGKESEEVILAYKNIGNTLEYSGKTDLALENYEKALKLCKKSLGENHLTKAIIYENIGKIYIARNDFEKAKLNTQRALEIRRDLLSRKNPLLAYSYNDLGLINSKLENYSESLMDFESALQACLIDYTPAGINTSKVPEIKNYIDLNCILAAFKGKLTVFVKLYENEKKIEGKKGKYLVDVINHINACDKTIDLLRQSNIDEKDKFQVTENSIAVYDLAVQFCYLSYLDTKEDKYLQMAFYYSEKLKAGTLLQAMVSSEAKKFANIPDSIIDQEKQIDQNLVELRKQMAESWKSDIQDSIFKLEHQKQNLAKYYETNYPKYFQLKYSNNLPDIKAIQSILDDKTALISYYQTDKSVFQIVLTKQNVSLSSKDKFENYNEKIEDLRYSIIHGDKKSNFENYLKLSNEFYELLFQQQFDKQIKNLVLIPTGNLATIPFESLISKKITGSKKIKDLPYLIKDYNISYSYSANLFYLTQNKQKQDSIEISKLSDWLAFAPVFSDESTSGISIRSRGMFEEIKNSIDTLKTRGKLINGNYISPLPGTENEVKSIFNQFDLKNKDAMVKIHQDANESFVKSGELLKYKYIHFATHGFVDSQNPELSGIILAQDSIDNNDGILFSGEIYNLELNADLVVLSACETGLGKEQSGEGIIGLTRALLYAGAKNLIVSLWQVSDEATSELMIEFYKEMLNNQNQKSFSEYLRGAKLKLINSGKFSHPFFWSPFILIGK